MMVTAVAATFLASTVMMVVCDNTPPPGGYYATKYDHLDVDRLLNTRRLVVYYAACLTNKGPCTPQGLEFKRILPEALRTNCLRCTEKQKVVTLRSIRRLRKEYPKIWAQLTEIWDPNDEYIRRFEETFSNSKATTTPSNFVELDNRFGDSSKVEVADINVPSVKPYPPPESTSTSTSTNAPSSSSSSSTTTSTTTTTTTTAPTTTVVYTTTTTKKRTTTPLTVTYGGGGGPFPRPPVSFRPPDLSVKGIVDSIGSIGSQVIRAGTRIAGMLISSVQSVVGH